MPLIRDYIAEHERATNLGGDAVRAIERGNLDTARELVAVMAEELTSHWRGEENGLFRVMQREELFAEHIVPLVREPWVSIARPTSAPPAAPTIRPVVPLGRLHRRRPWESRQVLP